MDCYEDLQSSKLFRFRSSKTLVFIVVAVAVTVNEILYCALAPIAPDILFQLATKSESNSSVIESHLSKQPCCQNQSDLSNGNAPFDGRSPHESLITRDRRNMILEQDNVVIGYFFGIKAIVQIIANLFIPRIIDKFGYRTPLCFGLFLLIISALILAFSSIYWEFFVGLALTGVAGAHINISAFGLLADTYHDTVERCRAIGIVIACSMFGSVLAKSFTATLYDFFNQATPFLIIVVIASINIILHLLMIDTRSKKILNLSKNKVDGPSLLQLVKDPYVVIATGALIVGNSGSSVLEGTLPTWLEESIDAPIWLQGTVFLPDGIGYIISANVLASLATNLSVWYCTISCLLVQSTTLFFMPYLTYFVEILGSMAVIGVVSGIVETIMLLTVANLVDQRYTSDYGNAFAITEIGSALTLLIGPCLGGIIIPKIGFQHVMWFFSGLSLLYSVILIFTERSLQSPNLETTKLIPSDSSLATNATERHRRQSLPRESVILLQATEGSLNQE
ncbi:unnamed protein product [Adineta ricciae]|uniref:Major facilitator superfamily (MFS) profile domain-containing protein n=1 Tax=Adineta ricciae TaxID=249248 RepID=A0A816EGA2_ADIRI|nr:unnamed protein product [Adineta ricciae]